MRTALSPATTATLPRTLADRRSRNHCRSTAGDDGAVSIGARLRKPQHQPPLPLQLPPPHRSRVQPAATPAPVVPPKTPIIHSISFRSRPPTSLDRQVGHSDRRPRCSVESHDERLDARFLSRRKLRRQSPGFLRPPAHG